MIRKVALNPLFNTQRGGPRPWRKLNTPIAIHASQRGPEQSDIDFATIGLKYGVTEKIPFDIPGATETRPNLPFYVQRTKVSGSLPVYTDYKDGRTRVVTILRNCRGDIAELKSDMEKVVEKEVIARPGKLVVTGNYDKRLKLWLEYLGF